MEHSDKYLAYMGLAPRRIPHWEHWSCPDAETYLTGIDYYEHPRLCRQRLLDLFPQIELPVPESDAPIPRPALDLGSRSSSADGQGGHRVRWSDGMTCTWDWGRHFQSAEDVFAFSPLEHADFTAVPVVESRDY